MDRDMHCLSHLDRKIDDDPLISVLGELCDSISRSYSGILQSLHNGEYVVRNLGPGRRNVISVAMNEQGFAIGALRKTIMDELGEGIETWIHGDEFFKNRTT